MNIRAQADTLATGERFVPEVQGDQPHAAGHLERYHFASAFVRPGDQVLDLACGVGFGSRTLADAGGTVLGMDCDFDSISYARATAPEASFLCADFFDVDVASGRDLVVSFETVEHIAGPLSFALEHLAACTRRLLIGSVPYRELPGNRFHCHFEIEECDLQPLMAYGDLSVYYQSPDGRITATGQEDAQNVVFVLRRQSIGIRPPDEREPCAPSLFDIIVPVIGDVAATCAALDSLIRQRESRWNAIVVIRDSSLDIRAAVERYTRADARIQSLTRPGVSLRRSLDVAIEHARAPFVGCLLPGTRFSRDWLQRCAAVIGAAPETPVIHGEVENFDDLTGCMRTSGVFERPRARPLGGSGIFDAPIHPSSVLFRRAALSGSWDFGGQECGESGIDLSVAAAKTAGQVSLPEVSVLEWRGGRQPFEFDTPSFWHEWKRCWVAGDDDGSFRGLVPAARSGEARHQEDLIWSVLDGLTDPVAWPADELRTVVLERFLRWLTTAGPHAAETTHAIETWRRYGSALPLGEGITDAFERWDEQVGRESASGVGGVESPPLVALPTLQRFLFWTTVAPKGTARRSSPELARRSVLIWGAGEAGRCALHLLSFLTVSGFVDSAPEKQQRLHAGLPVHAPTTLQGRTSRPFVVVASTYASLIGPQLEALGYAPGGDYVVVDIGAATRLAALK